MHLLSTKNQRNSSIFLDLYIKAPDPLQKQVHKRMDGWMKLLFVAVSQEYKREMLKNWWACINWAQ